MRHGLRFHVAQRSDRGHGYGGRGGGGREARGEERGVDGGCDEGFEVGGAGDGEGGHEGFVGEGFSGDRDGEEGEEAELLRLVCVEGGEVWGCFAGSLVSRYV